MTKGRFAMSAIQWLATLGLALLLPAAHATTAVVFSESTGRYGVTWNEPNKKEAIEVATDYCRKMGGGKNCKPLKVTDELGFGAVANTCAGNFCGISVITGRRSAAQAERDAIKDCNSYYGTNNCVVLDNWQETGAAAPVTKAPPSSNPPPQSTPPTPTSRSGEATTDTGISSKPNARSPESACNGGNAKDCFTLGRMYAKGDGIRQDKQKAAQFFDQACGLGDNGGCFYLGRMYEQGDGIRQDKLKAAKLFDKVCSSESAPGCYALGWMYKKGDGIRQDKQKAAQLYDKACGLRFGNGCGTLGLMYETGDGIRQDKQKAVQLYDKACDFGDSTSCEDAKKLRSGR